MDLLWVLSVSMLAACVAIPMDAVAGSHSLFTCEPITLRMCQGLPYNSTFMPNIMNHYDQQTAALAMEPFHPMVNLQCSPDLRMFLCAIYAPVCTEYGRMTLPCRRLCLQARSDCYKLMDMFGVSWPEEMDCNRFPDCDEPYPRPADLLSTSDSTESPVSVQRDYGFWCPRELKIEPELGYSFLGVRDCSPPCPNMYFTREELTFARYFIGVVSIVCLSATLFTFLTFLIDVSRFRYPERPIIFYAVCYMMVSLVFFLGFLLEDRVSCNAASPGRFRASTVTQGSHNKACTLLFMVLYFFTMAGSVWWVILTITWFLAAVPKWGSEAIEKKALLFHACAWGVPGVLTVTLLAMNKIEGDSVSGVCFVGLYNLMALRWFLLAPLGLDVVVGVVLLLAGIAALNRVRMEIPLEKENQEKLVKFMIRIGVFSVLYLVPLLTVVACYLYESSYRTVWETTWVQEKCRDYHIPCPYKVESTSRPDLALFLIKYLMMLIVGIPSVFWVGSKKTCFEWASFFHGKRRKEALTPCPTACSTHSSILSYHTHRPTTFPLSLPTLLRLSLPTFSSSSSSSASSLPRRSGMVNDSRQVLQEPDFAQLLYRDPNTPIVRKSRGTSTQGTSTHASSTHLAMLDEPPSASTSRAGSVRSARSKMSSYHGSLHRSRDGRYTTSSMPRLSDQSRHCSTNRLDGLSRHDSALRLDSQSRHSSTRDLSGAAQAVLGVPGNGIHRVLDEDGAAA
ncbi:frizzled-3a isoform X1 [Poecilia formosa]|uniref:frizzled-3a isoform X1 n=1 Tax=Poecilia formosa TaxID=48698 RepID=UPI0007B9CAD2|nr:PREDICTED: frizzled-3 isoform X1 [Poecilia formosa]XP_016534984.1 PREDICTED: frizzled-3 isoform X1 [Poecilia formosa]XP_016534985.1 PREDICTED: frizzled-3 isoform X1 [Poecilia formosa]